MKIRSLLVAILAISVIGFIPPKNAEAVTMSPVRLELAADPGDEAVGVVKVYNDEAVERTLYLSVSKFESKDETGDPVFIDDKDDIVSWLQIQPSVVIPGKEAREVPFIIKVPEGVDPGGYFGAVFASIAAPQVEGEATISLQSDVGTLVLFRVNGEFPEGETILEFNTKDKKTVHNSLPVEFYYRFQNSGADRAQPLGDITITNIFGGITKIVSANYGAGNVLPQSIRKFDAAWQTAGSEEIEENHKAVVYPEFKSFWDAVKYQTSNFALGRYTADLSLTVNNDTSRAYTKSTSFWVLPWQLLVVILAILVVFILPLALLVGAIVVYWRKRRKQRKQQ